MRTHTLFGASCEILASLGAGQPRIYPLGAAHTVGTRYMHMFCVMPKQSSKANIYEAVDI